MVNKDLKELQEALNEEKYCASEGAGFDKSGNMDWCDGCLFQNGAYKVCDLSHESRTANVVCARHKARKEEMKNATRKTTTSNAKRTTRKSSNV